MGGRLSCKPFQNRANTAGGQGDAGIRRTIIQMNRVAIGSDGVAAWKDDVVYIPMPLVRFFRAKYPLSLRLRQISGECKSNKARPSRYTEPAAFCRTPW